MHSARQQPPVMCNRAPAKQPGSAHSLAAGHEDMHAVHAYGGGAREGPRWPSSNVTPLSCQAEHLRSTSSSSPVPPDSCDTSASFRVRMADRSYVCALHTQRPVCCCRGYARSVLPADLWCNARSGCSVLHTAERQLLNTGARGARSPRRHIHMIIEHWGVDISTRMHAGGPPVHGGAVTCMGASRTRGAVACVPHGPGGSARAGRASAGRTV